MRSRAGQVNDQFFLSEKLERAVPLGVNGVPKGAVNCWKHGNDRAPLVVVGRVIDLLANFKFRHRELLLELSEANYLHQLVNVLLIIDPSAAWAPARHAAPSDECRLSGGEADVTWTLPEFEVFETGVAVSRK